MAPTRGRMAVAVRGPAPTLPMTTSALRHQSPVLRDAGGGLLT